MIHLVLMMKAKGRVLLVVSVGHRFPCEGLVVAVAAVRVIEAVVVHQVI